MKVSTLNLYCATRLVLSDKGYASAKNRNSLRARGIKNGVMYINLLLKKIKA